MRIFLIGFMCSGKSTVGGRLAPMLGLPFLDLDRVIEAQVGPLLPYIRDQGEALFREQEARALAALLNGPPAVIATGGGTPCEGEHLRRMLQAGLVVYLDVPYATLMERIIRSGGDRPLLFGLQGEALAGRVRDLLQARRPYYTAAHLHVDGTGTAEEVAVRIKRAIDGQTR